MRRRNFLRGAAAAGGLAALAGCSAIPLVGGSNAPPPRKSDVISDIEMQDGAMAIDLSDSPFVESRKEAGGELDDLSVPGLAALSPVGRAAAKGKGGKGGRGASGRGSGGFRNAPKTGKGRAKYLGGAYAGGWRKKHDDDIDRYRASIAAVGVAYLGTNEQFQDEQPGPGPVDWDEQVTNPENTMTYPVDREGWYRVGTRLESVQGSTDFGWESVDMEVDQSSDGMEIEEEWKVSPRL